MKKTSTWTFETEGDKSEYEIEYKLKKLKIVFEEPPVKGTKIQLQIKDI